MAVSDEVVATLRAQLAKDYEEYRRRWDQLDPQVKQSEYSALLGAAFCEAVERRFNKSSSDASVIEFVSEARAQWDLDGTRIDPRAAERMIRAVYTDEEIDDLDADTVIYNEVALLTALITDENLDDAGLDAFMTNARALADDWTN